MMKALEYEGSNGGLKDRRGEKREGNVKACRGRGRSGTDQAQRARFVCVCALDDMLLSVFYLHMQLVYKFWRDAEDAEVNVLQV